MTDDKRIALALLWLRLGVFVVMFMWTVDKLVRPEYAAGIFSSFYSIGGLGSAPIYILGVLELILLGGFLLGFKKRLTYGIVLALHGVSTLSAVRQYLAPFEGPNLLFYAAWPMLAACFALYSLRDLDRLWTMESP